jgi:excisionase family DNA binding protein
MQQESLITLNQAAAFLALSATTLYRLTSARKIPFYKVGHLKLFRQSELEAWLAGHKKEMLPAPGSKWTAKPSFGSMSATENGVGRL